MSNPTFYSAKNSREILCLIDGNAAHTASQLDNEYEILDPLKAEGAGEKHIPSVKISGSTVTVQVGSVMHPMTEEHSINWIYLETSCGGPGIGIYCDIIYMNASLAFWAGRPSFVVHSGCLCRFL